MNSTFSGNTAALTCVGPSCNGGGINIGFGTSSLTNVTIADNSSAVPGGGLANTGATINVKNSILSDNSGGDCHASSGGVSTSQGNNIAKDGTCGFAQPTDKQADRSSRVGRNERHRRNEQNAGEMKGHRAHIGPGRAGGV